MIDEMGGTRMRSDEHGRQKEFGSSLVLSGSDAKGPPNADVEEKKWSRRVDR